MEFFQTAGKLALGSRLRRLGEMFGTDAQLVYALYGTRLDPKWFPVFYLLMEQPGAAITELADAVGQTHPAVSQVVKEMTKAGIAQTEKCASDGRVNRVSLTAAGREQAELFAVQCRDVADAVEQLLSESGADLWGALGAVEFQLQQSSFLQRVKQARRRRTAEALAIVPFAATHRDAFKALNVAWIERHFILEPADHRALDHPEAYILKGGGQIAMALYDGEIVGSCALIAMGDGSYELAKMAVADAAQGLGIGLALGQHMIDQARALGAKRLYLETNSSLVPALALYRKLGFKPVEGATSPSPYARCDMRMELFLSVACDHV